MTDNVPTISLAKNNMAVLIKVLLFLFVLATILFNHSPIYHIVGLLMVAFAALTIVQTGKIRLHSFFGYFALFLIYVVIQIWVIGVFDKAAATDMLQTMLINFVIYYSLFVVLRQYQAYKSALKIYTYATIISAMLLMLVSLIHGELLQGRLMDDLTIRFLGVEMSYNSNTIANCCFLSVTVLLLDKQAFNKPIRYICFLVAMATILFSGSRKALLIIVAVILWNMLRKADARTIVIRLVAMCLLVCAVFFLVMKVPVLYNIIGSRFETLMDFYKGGTGDSSIRTRDAYLVIGWQIFLEHPWFGVGINNFKQFADTAMYSHNDYIELLSGCGFVGFLLCYLPKLAVIIKNVKQKRKDSLLFTILMLELLVVALGTVSYYKREDWLIFIFAMVCCDRFFECEKEM